MQKIEKDDIIIRKGIIHILDSHNGYLGLSNDLLDMGPDLMEFIRGHIFKILDSDDTKKCQFDGSISPIPALLEDMQEKEDDSFIKASRLLAESLFDIMCDSVTIPAADLVVVSFQLHSVVYLALLKMNYKETYVHKEAENEVNDIVKQRIMPMGGAKLTEAVIVDLLEYKVQLMDCFTRTWRISSPFCSGRAVTLAITGILASATSMASSTSFRRSAAGCIKVLWKGALTGSRMARLAPAAFRVSQASFTASVAPAMTTWPGQLKFTGCTASFRLSWIWAQISRILSASKAMMAAMAPWPTGTASCMN